MKKNKLLNLILRGSGGVSYEERDHESSQTPPEPVRQSSRQSNRNKKNKSRPPPVVVSQLRQPVERSTSWKFTNDQPVDSYTTINSSPSILDAIRDEQEKLDDDSTCGTLIEKSQSWSGDKLLQDLADESAISKNKTTGSLPKFDKRNQSIFIQETFKQRGLNGRKSHEGSTRGSEFGDESNQSSIYDHLHYPSFNDQDSQGTIENYALTCLDSGDNTSTQGSYNKLHGSRLSVLSANQRSSRKPSPRRSPQSNNSFCADETNYESRQIENYFGVPTISVSSSAPLTTFNNGVVATHISSAFDSPRISPAHTPLIPSLGTRSPRCRSPSARSPTIQSPTTELVRPSSRTSSHSPSRHSSRMSSRRSSRSPVRNGRPQSSERWYDREHSTFMPPNDRNISINHNKMRQPSREATRNVWNAQPPWQQSQNHDLPANDRMVLSKSISWQQHALRGHHEGFSSFMGRPHTIITRQDNVPNPVFSKSKSWQQHDRDPIIDPIQRQYNIHDRRAPRSPRHNVVSKEFSFPSQPIQNNARMIFHDERQSSFPVKHLLPGSKGLDYRDYDALETQKTIRAREQQRLEQKRQEQLRKEQIQREQYIQEKLRNEKQKYDGDYYNQYNQNQYLGDHHPPISKEPSLSKHLVQCNYNQNQLNRQRSGSQKSNKSSNFDDQVYHPPKEFMNQQNNRQVENSMVDSRQERTNFRKNESHYAPPMKSASLMSSEELLNTLKRQLALSSPPKTSRSKSVEAGRAAVEMGDHTMNRGSIAAMGSSIPTGLLSPALQALVAEKRARLKRSNFVFSGTGTTRASQPPLREASQPPSLLPNWKISASPSTRCTVEFFSFFNHEWPHFFLNVFLYT